MHPQEIHRMLEQGVPLLTATQRLAREWRRRYDDAQRRAGRAVWPSADVLHLGAWVRRTHEEALDAGALGLQPGAGDGPAHGTAPVVLSDGQVRTVWERIVADSAPARGLLRAQATAAPALEAWQRLTQWRLPVPAAGPQAPLELRAFAEWAAAYARRCAERGWLDPAALPDRVAEALRTGALTPPPRLLLAGFDELPPQTDALLAALRGAGTQVDALPLPRRGAQAVRWEAPDGEKEAWAAARWARHWLEREPEARIGIVVPDLAARRAQLLRILEDVLQPAAVLPGPEPRRRPFNLSRGLPLADYPIVAAALTLLGLTPAAQPLETWSALLRAPFLAGAEREAHARARLDVRLRGWGAAELSSASVQAAAGEHEAPALAAALGRWRRACAALPARQAPGAWAQAFSALLGELGWPGERPPDSAEYQTLERWRALLEELARLELVAPAMTRTEALGALRRMAAETEFQPEGPDAPVQVLGPLEAGGLEFDHLWVLGLHEELWPAPPRPNPFLPGELQRRHAMPRASVARELEIARRETERLRQAAPDVVFSHPRAEGERPLRPSPLIAALPLAADAALPLAGAPTLRETLGAAARLEALSDADAPPIAPGTPVNGGTSLFSEQAACPFRAFAHHRLHAHAPETPQPGLDAATRGTLVHAALEHAWRQIRDHATLAALDDAALQALLEGAVAAGIGAYKEQRPHALPPRLEALERRRLVALLRVWLAVERERTPFAVEALEQRQPLEIGGITVSGRMDRIDRLPDGRHVLIDYKTGRLRAGAWWGERPDEPQLPLYAASHGGSLAGVAFAQVRRDEPRFQGVADDPARFPGATRFDAIRLPPGEPPFGSFAAVVERWRAALEGLAGGFRAGDARVHPKRGDTCEHCDLPGLCRIAELRPGYALAHDEEGGDGDA
jgi:probable DNA repair protein